jgi:hypothetical protein
MKKRRCQGVLIRNELANDYKDGLVCCWCGTTQDRRRGLRSGDACRAMFARSPQANRLGSIMDQVRVTDACVGGARKSATKGAGVGRRPRKSLTAGAGRL